VDESFPPRLSRVFEHSVNGKIVIAKHRMKMMNEAFVIVAPDWLSVVALRASPLNKINSTFNPFSQRPDTVSSLQSFDVLLPP